MPLDKSTSVVSLALLPLAISALLWHSTSHAETTKLDSVLVEPDSEQQPETDNPLGTAISGETLRTLPGSGGDPIRGLQALPGMAYADDSEGEPAVRGSRPGDNIFEVDFSPVGYLFHMGGAISVFNADLVESFSVYPSAYGPEYAGATGGVIDVQLRDPKTDRLQGNVDFSFLHAGALIEGPVAPGQSFYLAARISYLDLLLEDQLDEEDGISFTQFPKYSDYQGKYVWHTGPDSVLRLQLTGASDEHEIQISEESEEIENEPLLAGRHYNQESFHEQSIVWDRDLSNGARIKSAISHHNGSGDMQAGRAGESHVSTDSYIAKSHFELPLNNEHTLKLGVRASRVDADIKVAFNDPGCTEFEPDCSISNAERLFVDESVQINGLKFFVKDNWYINDKLTLFPSLVFRTEDYLDEQSVEPRFSLEYAHRDDLIFSAGTGLYRAMPDYHEINEVFGNPELEYIDSIHGVIGVQKFFGPGTEIKSELYVKESDKLVTGDETTRYANNGKGTAYGLDTIIHHKLNDRLSGWLSLSLSKADREHKVTGESFDFDYDQPFNASLVANYKISALWEAGAKLWVHSGAPYTPVTGATERADTPGTFDPIYGEINSERFPVYHRLDLRFDRKIPRSNGRNMSAYLEVSNLLGTKNLSGYDYNADYSERTDIEQLPRLISLGFKADF